MLSPGRSRWLVLLPGLGAALAVALAARLVHGLLPATLSAPLGEVVLAVLLGLVAGNLLPLPTALEPGLRFGFGTVLRLAIVLLGARLSFLTVLAIGGKALAMIAVLMTLALLLAHHVGRLLGVAPRLAALIGVGTAVCGNTAISATAPVIGARDEEVSFAIATNTLLGTLAVFCYPLLGRVLGFSDAAYGTWVGTAVNDTSQVVAAGFAFSTAAGEVATAVKLTRNALMGVVIVLMGFLYGPREGVGRGAGFGARLRQSVPLFVFGFLGMALLNTLGAFDAASARLAFDLSAALAACARFLILVALAAVGLATRLAALRRTGVRPFYLGLIVAAATSATSLLLIHWLGPAGG